jgi:hypothetical protein
MNVDPSHPHVLLTELAELSLKLQLPQVVAT